MNQLIKVLDISFIKGLSIGLEYESEEGFFAVLCDLGFIRLMYATMTPQAAIDFGFVE